MKKFKVTFEGRLKTSIGALYEITEIVEHPVFDDKAICMKLYDKYEWISLRKIEQIEE